MRFLKLQVLLLVVAVLAVGGLAADVVLKNRAETELAAEVGRRVPGTTGIEANISSFPFVGRLLLSGQVPKVVVTAQHAGIADAVALSDIRVQVDDVEMDTGAAKDGRAVVKSIDRGSVQADLRVDQINPRLPRGFSVQLEDGKAVVSGPGGAEAKVTATPEGALQIKIASRTLLDLALPKTDLLPCAPAATFVTGAVRLTCTFDEIPPLLVDLARR